MPWGSLRIFVSSEEKDLEDERVTAIAAIESLFFEPIASERRGASDKSITEQNQEEVRNSDIYIGIFGSEHSEPTIQEFKVAREQRIPVLIYIKDRPNRTRDQNLEEFIKEIRDPDKGLVTENYLNVIDLSKKLRRDLSNLLSRRFREARRFELQSQVTSTRASLEKPTTMAELAPTIRADISKVIKRGDIFKVSAEFAGSSSNGFLDLYLRTPSGKTYWFPDPESWSSSADIGNKTLRDEKYQSTWNVQIPPNTEAGKYVAGIGMWEDPEGLPNRGRRLIVEKQVDLQVI